ACQTASGVSWTSGRKWPSSTAPSPSHRLWILCHPSTLSLSLSPSPPPASLPPVVALPSGGSKIFLEKPLRLMHFGDPKGVPDGYGGFVDQRAEVALLNRTIAITGTDEPAPYHREGGHFMIFMSSTPQFIEGVEFAQMGQQGKLGRYNIHFHVCGDDGGRSVVRKNVMHDSKQRCVVVHTTFNLTVEENVAYHTRGHCFMVEEGGETDNTFLRNLGIWTRAGAVNLDKSRCGKSGQEQVR
ncbi:unnamed protein product, partial [Closterium sp. NIES-53]